MADTLEDTSFIFSRKGIVLTLEMALCLIATICKAVSLGCYLWGSIVELVWAIIIFIIYAMKLDVLLRFLPWTDFFRAITGTLLLFICSLVCLKFAVEQGFSLEIAGSVFGLLAATVFGFDTLCIIAQIKERNEESNIILI
ncbi:proteolipid protein 2 [Danio aesculapii]|uniref:proteolipid protein 2 n=1 Tax=Danio aesculapii TaxID=1142201 RepID=UPI0024BF71BF|nr:proteolipid protein 2 [Danio aesculapii]